VLPLLPGELEVVAPDLRGFGGSDKHRRAPDGTDIGAGPAASQRSPAAPRSALKAPP